MTTEELERIIAQAVAVALEKVGVGERHPDAPLPAQEWYTIKTCALVTGVSPDHIRRAVVGHTLRSSDQGTKNSPYYLIHKDDLRKWMDDREYGARPPVRKKAAEIPASRHYTPRKSSKSSA